MDYFPQSSIPNLKLLRHQRNLVQSVPDEDGLGGRGGRKDFTFNQSFTK